eukprot:CAMPEP_0194046200 /NCGR_PEP_ID=MMETSP0009_2-20130614/20040_1 /TAXON_ID=210454 /ORGANISM="Grammatophora oceanica, Strain CCMP 410" /LENGTH=442 /DNA_ID=CAMNT_0038691401 /DNA_START=53 /DNA_END=1381 /DNA_ORIENTATION=+
MATVSTVSSHPTPSSPKRGTGETALECDYDVNPSFLYQAIEARQWDHCRKLFTRGDAATTQAATWVVRKEPDGRLRWRLLPVHSAIIFGAPLEIMELLLQAHPHGAQCKDDQGMLPLHLAFRNESDWDILEELLTAFPQAIHVKDRKGRTPAQCASSKTAKQAGVLELYTQIAISQERQRAVQESRTVLEARVSALQDTHVKTLQRLKADWEGQLNVLSDDLDKTKMELDITRQGLQQAKIQLEQKASSEKEVTEKLQQVTVALTTVNEARAAEHTMEKKSLQQREQQLIAANEELLLLVQTLLDQQTSLKVQLDKQAWEAKDRQETRQSVLSELNELTLQQESILAKDRDMWRQQLQESNEAAAHQLRDVLHKTKTWQAARVDESDSEVPNEVSTSTSSMVSVAKAEEELSEVLQSVKELEIKHAAMKQAEQDPPEELGML